MFNTFDKKMSVSVLRTVTLAPYGEGLVVTVTQGYSEDEISSTHLLANFETISRNESTRNYLNDFTTLNSVNNSGEFFTSTANMDTTTMGLNEDQVVTMSAKEALEKALISWDDATWILTSAFIIFTMQSGNIYLSFIVHKKMSLSLLRNVTLVHSDEGLG